MVFKQLNINLCNVELAIENEYMIQHGKYIAIIHNGINHWIVIENITTNNTQYDLAIHDGLDGNINKHIEKQLRKVCFIYFYFFFFLI